MNLRSLKFEHGLLTSTACVISRVLTVQLEKNEKKTNKFGFKIHYSEPRSKNLSF